MHKKKFIFISVLLMIISNLIVFTGCDNSNTVKKNGIEFNKITSIRDGISTEGYQVVGCSKGIEILNIPESIEGLPVLSIKKEAFVNNTEIREIIIPDSIESMSLCTAPFRGCSNVEKVTAPFSEIMLLFTDYGGGDYDKSHTVPASLHYVYLSRACTSIGYRDFYYCTHIRELHIPNTVTTINDGTGLTSIGVNGNSPDSDKFGKLPFIGCTNLTIYCEAESKPSDWGIYWNYIDATNYAKVVWNEY